MFCHDQKAASDYQLQMSHLTTLQVGQLFDNGKFKILKSLGEGLCSHVYLAEFMGDGDQQQELESLEDMQHSSSTITDTDCIRKLSLLSEPEQPAALVSESLNSHIGKGDLVALKVFKGHEMRQLANKEYDLMVRLQKNGSNLSPRESNNLPFVRAYSLSYYDEQSIASFTDEFDKATNSSSQSLSDQFYMVMEYCPNGDLFDFLKHTSKGALPKPLANTLFLQLLDAVQWLHQRGEIAHLDLKLENVLLTEDFHVKLCDLGFSESNHNRLFNGVGTGGYKAPEIHQITLPSFSEDQKPIDMNNMQEVAKLGYSGVLADVFSLGVILFTLHFGVPPFNEASRNDRNFKYLQFRSNNQDKKANLRYFLRNHPSTKPLLESNMIDYDLLDLITSLLAEDPLERPQSIADIKLHPYLASKMNNAIIHDKESMTMSTETFSQLQILISHKELTEQMTKLYISSLDTKSSSCDTQ